MEKERWKWWKDDGRRRKELLDDRKEKRGYRRLKEGTHKMALFGELALGEAKDLWKDGLGNERMNE
jgi:hypothetical protein